jgi:hypothetical protein
MRHKVHCGTFDLVATKVQREHVAYETPTINEFANVKTQLLTLRKL